jgi:surfactin synthase thioesterase subunit
VSRVSLLDRAPANQAVRRRLFCFPFAGGGASFYTGWEPGLPAGVAVQAVQFPGRENLLRESPISDLMLLVEAAAAAIKPVTTFPYAFFGHSLGALVAFELVRKFRREGVTAPSALVVSAHGAPQCPRDYPPLYQQPDERFLRAMALRYPGGIPDAFLRDPELVRLFSRTLRADYRALAEYRYRDDSPLPCPITACGGEEDNHVPLAALARWNEQTTGAFRLHTYPGDHFYIRPQRHRLLADLSRTLGPAT